MKNKLNLRSKMGLFLFVAMVFAFASCDPGQSLRIENKTAEKASIKFVFKKDSQRYRFGEAEHSDTLLVELDSTKSNSMKEYHFGIGTWEIQSSFDSLVAMVESVEINTRTSKQIFAGEQQIRDFFKSRITGRHKETIEIKLD